MAAYFLFIAAVLAITAIIKVLLAVYAPKAYEAMVADEDRRRQRRSGALKTGLGLAFKFFGK